MTPRVTAPRVWLAIYRRLVGLYPRSLRRQLGREMEGLFLDLYAEARVRGRLRGTWLALRACAEILPRAFRAHRDPESPTGAFVVRTLFTDLVFAWQVATRQQRHSGVVIATVAIGIAATTAVFSVADAAILRRLPFPDGERLVDVAQQFPGGWSIYSQDDAAFRTWSEQTRLFDFLGGYDTGSVVGEIAGEPSEIDSVAISPGLLGVLGARPVLGRLLVDEDALEGAPAVALISDRVWRREFASAPDAIGGFIAFDGVDHEVVGVLPSAFAFPYGRTDVWRPLDPMRPGTRARALGRLAAGVDLDGAREMADTLAAGIAEIAPRAEGWQLGLVPLEAQRTSEQTRTALWVALAAAGLLLLVAIVNVAQVALARSIQREGELSVRAALGAGRSRVIRQVIFESLLLCLAGGALGIVGARALVAAIATFAPPDLLHMDALRIAVDWRALAVALGLALVAGVGVGLLPAWSASRPSIASALHGGRRGVTISRRRRRLQGGLIAAESALCLVLLAGAGLLLSSFGWLAGVDPGFDADSLATLIVRLDAERYPTPETRVEMLERLAGRVERLPGVERAIVTGGAPPVPGGVLLVDSLEAEGGERVEEGTVLPYGGVSAGYFEAAGIEIVAGRPLATTDDGTDNVVIAEPLARRLFGERDAVGRRFRHGDQSDDDWWTVVGVSAPTASMGLATDADDLQVYRPLRGNGTPRAYVAVMARTSGNPAALAPLLRAALWEIDPLQPVHKIELGSDRVADWVLAPRFHLLLFGTFAGVGLVLVLVGIAGVVGHVVASRTREIGIRVALGAGGRSILMMATLGGLRPVALGLLAGGFVVWQTTHFLATLLYGIEPNHLPTLAAVAGVFLVATVVASYLPARRALRVDPVRALRAE